MARDEKNYVSITSIVGFKKPGPNQAINVVAPAIETTKNFEDSFEQPYLGLSTVITKIIETNSFNTFTFITFVTATDLLSQAELIEYTQSNTQTLSITNLGNSDVNVSDIAVSPFNGAKPVFHTTTSFTISSGTTVPVVLGYYADIPGTFINYLDVISDNGLGPYRVPTRQVVGDIFSISISPTSTSSTSTVLGEIISQEYVITPIFNNEIRPDIILDFTATLSAETDNWSIEQGENSFTVNFIHVFGTTNGNYANTITVDTIYQDISVTETASIDIDVDVNLDNFENIGSWISAFSLDNGVIGFSYDILDGDKFLTIGVGSGADESPEIASGGYNFVNTDFLGFQGRYELKPYAYWKEVYVFPITGSAQTLYSSNYLVKSETEETDRYGYYFGDNASLNSMFTVTNDGDDNLTITLNNLRELTGDAAFDKTLKSLARSFYYYASTDRLNQLGGSLIQGRTPYLIGINKFGSILTTLRTLP